MSVTAPVSTRLDLQRGVMQNEKRRKRAVWPAEQVEQYDTYPAGHPYSWSTIGSMEDLNGRRVRRCSDNERVMSTCSRAYPPHAHIAHSIEWLYWGHSITEAEASADRADPQGHQPRRGELRRFRGRHDVDDGVLLDLVVVSHDLGLPGAPGQREMLLQRRYCTGCVRVPLVLDPVRWRRYHHAIVVLHRLHLHDQALVGLRFLNERQHQLVPGRVRQRIRYEQLVSGRVHRR